MRLLISCLVVLAIAIGGYTVYRSRTSVDRVVDEFVDESLIKMRRSQGVELVMNLGPIRESQFTVAGSYLGDVQEGSCKSKSVGFYRETNGKDGRQSDEEWVSYYRADTDTWTHFGVGFDPEKPLDEQLHMDCRIELKDGAEDRLVLGPCLMRGQGGADRWRLLAMWGSDIAFHWRERGGRVQIRCRRNEEKVEGVVLKIQHSGKETTSVMPLKEVEVDVPELRSGPLRVRIAIEKPSPELKRSGFTDWNVHVSLSRLGG